MIKEGDTLPIVTWDMYTCDSRNPGGFFGKHAKRSWKKLQSDKMFEKRCIVVGVPGAWTDKCTFQMSSYEGMFDSLYTKDIENIYFLSVNDSYVMQSWFWGHFIIKLGFIADGNGEFTEKIGMLVDKSNMGYSKRSWRYAMVVENNKVEKLLAEKGIDDNVAFDFDPFVDSGVEKMIKYLRSIGRKQGPPDEGRWYFKVPFPEVDTSKFGQEMERDFVKNLAEQDLEYSKWMEENKDAQDFNPETDSIYHKEMEEEDRMKQDDEMESKMLGS